MKCCGDGETGGLMPALPGSPGDASRVNVAWECRHSQAFPRIHKNKSTPFSPQCILISSSTKVGPFFVKGPRRERTYFSLISVKFFRSNDEQWEIFEGREPWRRTRSVPRFAQAHV